MNSPRADRVERLLLREHDRTLAALRRIEEEEAEPQAFSAGDAVRGQKTPADAASDTQEQESDFLMATRLSAHLAEVDEALVRLRETPATFGVCTACGARFDDERLEMVPWASLCGACAREAHAGASS